MRSATQLLDRPTVGKLVVPYMVDLNRSPIDFKAVDEKAIKRCATANRCGVCGGKIRAGFAFIGPNDGRRCFADPWMHPDCARLAMSQCPFLAGRSGWRESIGTLDPASGLGAALVAPYEGNMALFLAPGGDAHRGKSQEWHFRAAGELLREEASC